MFGFGGSKSKQSSQSTSVGYGYNGSASDSFSQGNSSSQSGGQSTSTQSIAFQDLFAQLFGGASNVAGKLAGQSGGLTDTANMLFSGGVDFLNQLGGGADTDYLASRLNGDNSLLQDQIDSLGSDIGDFFRNEINPSITSEAVAGGSLGGGRQGVAQGAAADAAAKQFASGVTQLRSNDQAQRDAAAAQLAQIRQSGATAGLSALPGLYGVAESGFGAELAPYQALAQILGGPTVLTQGQSTNFSTATSADIARAISKAFGEDFTSSQSSSKGKSVSASIGF